MIDLHNHTYYSDGKFSPAEVVQMAATQGVKVLAITDHDNAGGNREAKPLAQAAGIELIPGVEFTTRWDGANLPVDDANVDLLGLFLDLDDPEFQAFEKSILGDIHQRMVWVCERLTAEGYPVTMDDLFAENPRYGGMMQLIHAVQTKGYAKTWDEAVKMSNLHWLRAPLPAYSVQQVIHRIHRAGGVAVLPHPINVNPNGKPLEHAYLRQLVEAGLDGIEVYHARMNEERRQYFLGLARQFDLLVSGGTDLHGWTNRVHTLGKQGVTEEMLEKLRERSRLYRQENA